MSIYTALRAVKETEKCDESHGDLNRQCGKAPVAMSTVLHCVYLALRHPPPDRGDISDQYTHFLFIYTALRGSKRMRSAINRTSTSPDSVASPQLQCAQFFIVFSSLRCHHAAGSSGDILGQWTHFCPPTRPCVRSKKLRSAKNCTSTSFNSVVSPQL